MTIDLTKLDRSLGSYDAETAGRLMKAYWDGGVIEMCHGSNAARDDTPRWWSHDIYRLRPEPLRDMVVPLELWRMLHPKWRWMARDENDDVWAYDFKPEREQSQWVCPGSDCLNLPSIFAPGLIDPGTKPWDQSLIERPEGV